MVRRGRGRGQGRGQGRGRGNPITTPPITSTPSTPIASTPSTPIASTPSAHNASTQSIHIPTSIAPEVHAVHASDNNVDNIPILSPPLPTNDAPPPPPSPPPPSSVDEAPSEENDDPPLLTTPCAGRESVSLVKKKDGHLHLSPSSVHARKISESIKQRLSDFWAATWMDVDIDVKKALFADYMALVHCSEPKVVTIAMIKEAWNRKAMDVYASIVHNMKEREKKKKGRPAYVLEPQWNHWVDYWNLPEVISKSEKASINRKSNPRLHTCGSISMEETAEKMSLKLGRPVSVYEVFRKTHLKNKKEIAAEGDPTTISEEWVDSAAKNFEVQYKAAYDERLNALRDEADEDVGDVPPEQQVEIFHSLAPLNAKGRAYPAGNLLDDTGSATQ